MGFASAQDSHVLSPKAFVHIVLRTPPENVKRMADFYKVFLGAQAAYETDAISFMTYDEEHHRIAVVGIPNTGPKEERSCGLEHFAFSYDSLRDLTTAYRQRKAHNILPFWCVNHGPTTSIYYRDPDGNKIETQVDNMDAEAATAFMMSPAFSENSMGVDFDPEELIRQLDAGVDDATLKVRHEIGPRGLPDHIL